MAKYKNREVHVLREIPNLSGDLVEIEHREPGTNGKEIVPRHHVTVSKDEKKSIDEQRQRTKNAKTDSEFRVEGETDKEPIVLPSVEDVKVQKQQEKVQKEAQESKKEDKKPWQAQSI